MTNLLPFTTSREFILSLWSLASQSRHSLPDARAPELFVLLHGMLFANIQLDDFQLTLALSIERLEIKGVEEREIMMGVINIPSILECGRPQWQVGAGPKEAGGPQAAAMRVMAKKAAAGVPGSVPFDGVDEEKMDVDDDLQGNQVIHQVWIIARP
jgi:hypothetical protein